ncbi:MAG: hypothetical protein HOQ24_14430, partial [Mycobacteriaceae bacterium]|nr:hypothetical protein [Mycobacteriaceae bacterium]
MRANKSSTQAVRLGERALCTGETVNQATKQLGADGGPLMPVAVGGQPDLEAELLLSLNRAARRARAAHRGTAPTGPMVRRVRLLTRALWLEVAEDTVGRLLAASLPSIGAEGFEGIAGLRPDPGRDHLDLRLMGVDGSARGIVRLLGVTRNRWRDAIRHIDGDQETGEPVWLDHRDALHEAEMAALESAGVMPTDLMSAVIRRYPLWRRAAWVDSMVEGESLRVRWQSGPRDAVVAAILADSACRIPGVTVAREPLTEAMQSIILSYTQVTANVASDPGRAWAEFRAAGIDLPEPFEQPSQPSEPVHRPRSPIVPEVWDQQEMRDALARREISAVYRLLRRHGVSQRQIAA